MTRYSQERKAAVLKKLLPPVSRSVADVAREEGITDTNLYDRRKQALNGGAGTYLRFRSSSASSRLIHSRAAKPGYQPPG